MERYKTQGRTAVGRTAGEKLRYNEERSGLEDKQRLREREKERDQELRIDEAGKCLNNILFDELL